MGALDLNEKLKIPQEGRLPPVEIVLAFKHGGYQEARVAVESLDRGLGVAKTLVTAARYGVLFRFQSGSTRRN